MSLYQKQYPNVPGMHHPWKSLKKLLVLTNSLKSLLPSPTSAPNKMEELLQLMQKNEFVSWKKLYNRHWKITKYSWTFESSLGTQLSTILGFKTPCFEIVLAKFSKTFILLTTLRIIKLLVHSEWEDWLKTLIENFLKLCQMIVTKSLISIWLNSIVIWCKTIYQIKADKARIQFLLSLFQQNPLSVSNTHVYE